MSWGSKDQLIAENAALKRENELLHEFYSKKEAEVEELRATIKTLQDALIYKEAPVVYKDMRMAEEAAAQPQPNPEEIEKQKQISEANRLLLREIEGDLFKDAEDMIDTLSRVAGGPAWGSLHGNEES